MTAAVADAPAVPDGAGFPSPVTLEERQATGTYLAWLATLGDHDRKLVDRAKATKAWCDQRSGAVEATVAKAEKPRKRFWLF